MSLSVVRNAWTSLSAFTTRAFQNVSSQAIPMAQSAISCVGLYLVSLWVDEEERQAWTLVSLGGAIVVHSIQAKRSEHFLRETQNWID